MVRRSGPLAQVVLLLWVVWLRQSTFAPAFVPEGDANWLLLGQRTLLGFVPYTETLTHAGPLQVAMATLWVGLWGSASLWALKVAATVATFGIGLVVNVWYAEGKLGRSTVLPGLLATAGLSLPTGFLELRALALEVPLALVVVGQLTLLTESRSARWPLFFRLGFLLGALLLWHLRLVPLVLLAFFVLYRLTDFRLPRTLTLLGGFLPWLVLVFVAGWASRGFGAWLHYTFYEPFAVVLQAPWRWGGFGAWAGLVTGLWVGLVVAGWFFFRLRYFRLPIRARSTEGLLLVWALFSVLYLAATPPSSRSAATGVFFLLAGGYGPFLLNEALRSRLRRVLRAATVALLVLVPAIGLLNPGPQAPAVAPVVPAGAWVWAEGVPAHVLWLQRWQPANPDLRTAGVPLPPAAEHLRFRALAAHPPQWLVLPHPTGPGLTTEFPFLRQQYQPAVAQSPTWQVWVRRPR